MVGSFLLKGSRLTQAKRLHIINLLLLGSSVAEQVTVNHLVAGSNPARAAIFIFFFKQKTAYEIHERLVGSEMCIRDRVTT